MGVVVIASEQVVIGRRVVALNDVYEFGDSLDFLEVLGPRIVLLIHDWPMIE